MASELTHDKQIIDTEYGIHPSRIRHDESLHEYSESGVSKRSGQWFVLYVKSRHEIVTQADLARRGIETYLPLVKKLRQWKDRKKFVEFPLFPGYLFVCIAPNPEEYLRVLKARGAVTFISLEPGYPTPVYSDEIYSLKKLIESGKEIDVYPHLKEGKRMMVKRGPLKGAAGVIKKREDQHVFLVNVELLGRSVGVKIYADDIEAA